MKLTIFAKKRNTKEGKVFFTYITKMKKKTGEEITATVKFQEECGNPKAEKCPMNIEVDKHDANFNIKTETDEAGEVYTRNTLWVSAWKPSADIYVDHSMDDFE